MYKLFFLISFLVTATTCRRTHWVGCIRYSPCQILNPLRCTARWQSMAVASPSFPAASLEDHMRIWLLEQYSEIRKMSCWSCRRRLTAASHTPWSNLIHLSVVRILGFWSTASQVTQHHRTPLWKNIFFSASFLHQLHEVTVTKASNPTGTRSSLETATKILTACLRSCQTTIYKPPVAIIRTWFTRAPVSPWAGVPRPFPSPILIAWCQTSSSS